MKLKPQDIINMLQSEINWCLDNPDKELNHDQQMGFVNGLRQAQLLIERLDTPPLKYWQHEDTGRLCASPIQPSDRWYEVPEGFYEQATDATTEVLPKG